MNNKGFNGERLKCARLLNGLTLTELAEKTNISKQSISLYENNRNIPDYERVYEIAKVLGVPYEFFFQEEKFKISTETTYFRSLVSTTKKERISQKIKLEFVARMYEVFWKYIEFNTFNVPSIQYDGFEDILDAESEQAILEIETIANMIREYWQIGEGPIDDLQYVLETNGIIITEFSCTTDKIDACSQRTIIEENEIYLIAVVIGKQSESRIRFDMAHELGHILLHPWSEDLESISKEEFKVREKQANMFASAFLLPKDTFGKEIAQYPTDLNYYIYLKEKWKVSIQAMIYRTHQLKIITTNQYQYLMRQISKKGWKIDEPGDTPFYPNESIFQGAVDLLFDNKILTPKTLMEEFRKNGISLYNTTIEELLHLREGTLKYEEKIIPLVKLKKDIN